ncbi:unnamed protein product, partial [Mesorhabditis belari]|uniref:Peptidase metallopeptidase domain-containing protein n=1 Tax=Mesorhabditis belari TaxID=2138241 RepID=A0AAF3JA04_9BILA
MKSLIVLWILIPSVLSTLPGLSGSVPTLKRPVPLGVHAPGVNGGPVQKSPVEVYLDEFGYTASSNELEPPTPFDLQMGLLRFQMYHGLYRSGLFDVETEEKMALHRCENEDLQNGATLKAKMLLHPRFRKWRLRLNRKFMKKLGLELDTNRLWKKKSLQWSIQGTPNSLTQKETREALVDAISRWENIGGFRFFETDSPNSADILFSFEQMSDKKHPTVVSRASGPNQSRVVFDKFQPWSHVIQYPGSLSLHRAALHSIGHSLGLQHTPEIDSLMNPLFKSAQLFSKITAIPNEDDKTLRELYAIPAPTVTQSSGETLKCPKHLDSVTAVSENLWFFFRKYNVWSVKNRKFQGEHRRIKEVFPDGPDFVNATVTSNGLTVLFAERTIYGYQYDAGRFVKAEGFPRELHERVLFFPQAAFPLTNGSIVLLSGNVFATYDVLANMPHILNDKNRMFPNLPFDVRSGIPVHTQDYSRYYMFDETTVSEWQSASHEATPAKPITDFFICST